MNASNVQDKTSEKSQTQFPAVRRPIFEYPALGKWEMRLYFCVWFTVCGYAWYRVWQTSRDYLPSAGTHSSVVPSPWPDVFGKNKKDVSNYEWKIWTPWAIRVLPWLLTHSILFNVCEKITGTFWKPMMLIFWLFATCWLTRWTLIALIIVEGLLIFGVAVATKNRLSIWLTGILFLYSCTQGVVFRNVPLLNDFLNISYEEFLLSIILMSYKLLQYISFSMEYWRQPELQRRSFVRNLFDMFWYSFYLPYLISVVVIYKTFPESNPHVRTYPCTWRHQILDELKTRNNRTRNVTSLIIFAMRMIFWALAIEVIQHFFYFDAMMADPRLLRRVGLETLPAIGYVAGSFFHMKYVLIFGLPSLFAKIDNMVPPGGPICISRVALYSKMWRQFDKGLYSFFKEYIFLPVCEPTFSLWRKLTAVFICYGFVLVWHGMSHNYVVWVEMSIVELVLEYAGKGVYVGTRLKAWREKYMSDRVFRRLLVFFQIFPLCFGLYGTFYFIGNAQSGWIFVDRIFWAETVTLQAPLWILVTIGYFFVSSCMEMDRLQQSILKSKTN